MHAQRPIPITSNGKDFVRINRFNFIVFDFASDEAIAFDATNAPSKVNSISPATNRPPQNIDVPAIQLETSLGPIQTLFLWNLALIDYSTTLSFIKRHNVFSIAGLNFCACTFSNNEIFYCRALNNFFVTNDFSLDIFKFDWNTVCLNVLNITIGKL